MHIVKLTSENFKRIKAVTVKPDGSLIVVGGKNDAGKSSTLDAIEAALGGKKHSPKDPVRHGAKKARVVLETEELIVERTFTAKKSELKVTSKDGKIHTSPQKLLNSLVGELSFDPLAWVRQDAKEQAATLRKVVKLDFTKEDAKRDEYYTERTVVGRELKSAQAIADSLERHEDAEGQEERSTSELVAELKEAQATNRTNAASRDTLVGLRERGVEVAEEIKATQKQLREWQDQLADINKRGKAAKEGAKKLQDIDTDAIETRIANADETNRKIRENTQEAEATTKVEALAQKVEGLTERINQVDEVKRQAAESAKYPVDGLELTDEGVMFGGVPFEQASQSGQLKCAVAIGLALNPKLKIVLVRDASLLDKKSLATMAQMADEADAQLWLEVVSETAEGCTVYIVEGEVAS